MNTAIQPAPLRIASTAAAEVTITQDKITALAANGYCRKQAPCDKNLKIGIFFDGTNNNRQRDKLDHIDDRKKQYHSNIVRLFDAHKDFDGVEEIQSDESYRVYVPGVGTRFEESGDFRESQDGKAMAKGGQARILFALLEVYNSVHRAFNGNQRMFDKAQIKYYIKKYVTDLEAPKSSDEQRYTRPSWFAELTKDLDKKIAEKRKILPLPHLISIKVSVFGFSRGAVQARAFCYWFQDMLKDGALAGIPASISFLGLFDSVATVGISYSANETIPVLFFWTDGHGAWAGEIKKALPSCVQQGVHFIAAHEQRMNFPVTRVHGSQIVEYLYPGVHSDVGGGYGCRDQGRALSPENMLSQIPLLQMYKAALLAGVPLVHYAQMSDDLKADFNIGTQVVEAWNTYMAADDFGGSYEAQVKQHMRLYYSYRSKWLYNDMKKNLAVIASNGQDRQDLLSYNTLLQGDKELQSKRKVHDYPIGTDIYGSAPSPLSREPNAASIGNAWQVLRYDRRRPLNAWEQFADEVFSRPRTAKQEAACLLLERYVHDSLAGFWMAGYLSDEEKAEGILDMAKKGGPPKGDVYRLQVWQRYQAKPELQQIVQSKHDLQTKAEQARSNGQFDRRDELDRQSTFTSEEQAQLAELFPMQTDANAAELRHPAIKTQTWTLREGGGYFYPRVAF